MSAEQEHPRVAAAFEAAAQFWQQNAALCRSRDEIYEATDGRAAKFFRVGQLRATRGYRARRTGGLGRNALLRYRIQACSP